MDAVSIEALVGILKRRSNSKGEYLSSYSGSKVKLISNVKKLDRDLRAILYRTLIPENMYMTSQHILYYCMYYSVSFTILHVPCFPVSDVEASSSTSVHHTCSHLYKYSLI